MLYGLILFLCFLEIKSQVIPKSVDNSVGNIFTSSRFSDHVTEDARRHFKIKRKTKYVIVHSTHIQPNKPLVISINHITDIETFANNGQLNERIEPIPNRLIVKAALYGPSNEQIGLSMEKSVDEGFSDLIKIPVPPNIKAGDYKIGLIGHLIQHKTISPISHPQLNSYNDLDDDDSSLKHSDLYSKVLFDQIIPVKYDGHVLALMIQMEKPVYKQGQLVRFRVVMLQPNFKPYLDTANIYIMDPYGNTLQRWLNRQSNMGALTLEYQLGRRPQFGLWSINVTVLGQTETTTFLVEEYYENQFEVNVTTVNLLSDQTDHFDITIEANYTYQEGVYGKAQLELILLTPMEYINFIVYNDLPLTHNTYVDTKSVQNILTTHNQIHGQLDNFARYRVNIETFRGRYVHRISLNNINVLNQLSMMFDSKSLNSNKKSSMEHSVKRLRQNMIGKILFINASIFDPKLNKSVMGWTKVPIHNSLPELQCQLLNGNQKKYQDNSPNNPIINDWITYKSGFNITLNVYCAHNDGTPYDVKYMDGNGIAFQTSIREKSSTTQSYPSNNINSKQNFIFFSGPKASSLTSFNGLYVLHLKPPPYSIHKFSSSHTSALSIRVDISLFKHDKQLNIIPMNGHRNNKQRKNYDTNLGFYRYLDRFELVAMPYSSLPPIGNNKLKKTYMTTLPDIKVELLLNLNERLTVNTFAVFQCKSNFPLDGHTLYYIVSSKGSIIHTESIMLSGQDSTLSSPSSGYSSFSTTFGFVLTPDMAPQSNLVAYIVTTHNALPDSEIKAKNMFADNFSDQYDNILAADAISFSLDFQEEPLDPSLVMPNSVMNEMNMGRDFGDNNNNNLKDFSVFLNGAKDPQGYTLEIVCRGSPGAYVGLSALHSIYYDNSFTTYHDDHNKIHHNSVIDWERINHAMYKQPYSIDTYTDWLTSSADPNMDITKFQSSLLQELVLKQKTSLPHLNAQPIKPMALDTQGLFKGAGLNIITDASFSDFAVTEYTPNSLNEIPYVSNTLNIKSGGNPCIYDHHNSSNINFGSDQSGSAPQNRKTSKITYPIPCLNALNFEWTCLDINVDTSIPQQSLENFIFTQLQKQRANCLNFDQILTHHQGDNIYNINHEKFSQIRAFKQFTKTLQIAAQFDRITEVYQGSWLWHDFNIGSDGYYIFNVKVPRKPAFWYINAFSMSQDKSIALLQTSLPLITNNYYRNKIPHPNVITFDSTLRFYMIVDVPNAIMVGEQLGIRVAVFNYNNRETEVLIRLSASPCHKSIIIHDLEEGIVSSYSTPTASGERQVLLWLEASSTQVVYVPIVFTHTTDACWAAFKQKTFIQIEAIADIGRDVFRKDILVDIGGVKQTFHTPFVIDLTNKALQTFNLYINITETPIIPLSRARSYIFGSPKATIGIVGDVVGPMFAHIPLNARNMLDLPYWSGDHIAFNLGVNFYTLRYLQKTTSSIHLSANEFYTAIKYLNIYYQRLLSHMNLVGGFCQFPKTLSPSGRIMDELSGKQQYCPTDIILTSHIVRILHALSRMSEWEADSAIYIQPSIIAKAVAQIVEHLNKNRQTSDIYQYQMNPSYNHNNNDEIMIDLNACLALLEANDVAGEIGSKAYFWRLRLLDRLAKYVLERINDNAIQNNMNQPPNTVVDNYLKNDALSSNRIPYPIPANQMEAYAANKTYILALVSYALSLSNHVKKDEVLRLLLSHARKTDDGLMYWCVEDIPGLPKRFQNNQPHYGPLQYTTWQALCVETTSYALMSILLNRSPMFESNVLSIIKWLNQQRNHMTGFESTRDTLIALQALTKYSEAELSRPTTEISLEIQTTSDTKFNPNVSINAGNLAQLHGYRLKKVWGSIRVTASGRGLALFQLSASKSVDWRQYVRVPAVPAFDLKHSIATSGFNSSIMQYHICTRWVQIDVSPMSDMAIVEIDIPTGFTVQQNELDRSIERKYGNTYLRKGEFIPENSKAVFYFDHIPSNEYICFNFVAERWYPLANMSEWKSLKVYEYYNPTRFNATLYEAYNLKVLDICHVCGSFQCPYCPGFNSAFPKNNLNNIILFISILSIIYAFNFIGLDLIILQ